MKTRFLVGLIALMTAIAVPERLFAFQDSGRTNPADSPAQSEGQIPVSERNEVSERERNLGTNQAPASESNNNGELTGARPPDSISENLPENGRTRWGMVLGGFLLGGLLGFLLGRTSYSVRSSSRDRAA